MMLADKREKPIIHIFYPKDIYPKGYFDALGDQFSFSVGHGDDNSQMFVGYVCPYGRIFDKNLTKFKNIGCPVIVREIGKQDEETMRTKREINYIVYKDKIPEFRNIEQFKKYKPLIDQKPEIFKFGKFGVICEVLKEIQNDGLLHFSSPISCVNNFDQMKYLMVKCKQETIKGDLFNFYQYSIITRKQMVVKYPLADEVCIDDSAEFTHHDYDTCEKVFISPVINFSKLFLDIFVPKTKPTVGPDNVNNKIVELLKGEICKETNVDFLVLDMMKNIDIEKKKIERYNAKYFIWSNAGLYMNNMGYNIEQVVNTIKRVGFKKYEYAEIDGDLFHVQTGKKVILKL